MPGDHRLSRCTRGRLFVASVPSAARRVQIGPSAKTPHSPQHVCPRCGYDQAGHMATWSPQAWPVVGVCSECGLNFEWADVLSPDRSRLAWLYEHTAYGRIGVWRFVRTVVSLIFPWVFWRQVRLRHVLAPRRLLIWMVLLVVPLWVLGAAVRTANVYLLILRNGTITGLPPTWKDYAEPWVWPLIGRGWEPFSSGELTLSLRYWPPSVQVWLGMALAMPLLFLLLSHSRRLAKVRPMHVWRVAAYSAVWTLVPMSLILSDSIVSLLSHWPDRAGALQSVGRIYKSLQFMVRPMGYLAFAWFAVYWLFAATAGLKLERGPLIWFLTMIAAGLFGCLCAVFLSGGQISRW